MVSQNQPVHRQNSKKQQRTGSGKSCRHGTQFVPKSFLLYVRLCCRPQTVEGNSRGQREYWVFLLQLGDLWFSLVLGIHLRICGVDVCFSGVVCDACTKKSQEL